MENKKVALFMLPPLTQAAGAEKYFINLARHLNGIDNLKIDVVTLDKNSFKKLARLIHIYYHLNFFKQIDITGREKKQSIKERLGNAQWREVSFKNLKTVLSQYDLIYSKNEIVELVFLKLIGFQRLPPVIVGVHTPIFYPYTHSLSSKIHNLLYLSFFYKWLLKGARCIHVSNKFTKDLVVKKFKMNARLIYYPFSVKDIQGSIKKIKPPMSFASRKKNIAFVARLSEQKGIQDLASLIFRIGKDKEIRDKLMFNIFGSGDKNSEEIVDRLQKKYPFVKWYGYVENKYIPGILSQQDLFISTAKWEVLPFSILEAQAVGLPVIAFNVPGPKDIIVNGKTGFLVSNISCLYSHLKDFVLEKRQLSRQKIIAHIETKFSPSQIYSQILKMMEAYLFL